MNIQTDKILTQLHTALKNFEHVERAVLFGSRARGDFNERSDYDVAIYGELPANERYALHELCAERLPTLHKIDLIFMSDTLDQKFTDRIHAEEIVFYEKAQ